MDLNKLQEDFIALAESAFQIRNTPTIAAHELSVQTTLTALIEMYCAQAKSNSHYEKRKVMVTLVNYWKTKLEFPADQNPFEGYLLGIFQSQDGDNAEPVAVVELESGQVVEVAVDKIQFIDWEDD